MQELLLASFDWTVYLVAKRSVLVPRKSMETPNTISNTIGGRFSATWLAIADPSVALSARPQHNFLSILPRRT